MEKHNFSDKINNLQKLAVFEEQGYASLSKLLNQNYITYLKDNPYLISLRAMTIKSGSPLSTSGVTKNTEYFAGEIPDPLQPRQPFFIRHPYFKDGIEFTPEEFVLETAIKRSNHVMLSPGAQERLRAYFGSLEGRKPDSELYLQRSADFQQKIIERQHNKSIKPIRRRTRFLALDAALSPETFLQDNGGQLLTALLHEHRAPSEVGQAATYIGELVENARLARTPSFTYRREVKLHVDDFTGKGADLKISGESAKNLTRYISGERSSDMSRGR